jgi:hypothetical protein
MPVRRPFAPVMGHITIMVAKVIRKDMATEVVTYKIKRVTRRRM